MLSSDRETVRNHQLAQLSEEQKTVLEDVMRDAHRNEWIEFRQPAIAEESLRQFRIQSRIDIPLK